MRTFDLGGLELFDRNIPKCIKNLSNEKVLGESAAYVLKLNKKIARLKRLPPDTHKIHAMRIKLKIMYEILDIISNLNAKSGLQPLQSNINSLNHKIGDWHDYTILTHSLKHFVFRVQRKKSVRDLKGLVKDIESQQDKREKKIYKALDRYMTDKQRRKIESML